MGRGSLVLGAVKRRRSGGAALTYLEAQAAALLPGRWVALTGMGGLDYALIEGDGVGGMLDYCNHGGYDKVAKRLLFQGGAHPGLTTALRYVMSTNLWGRITPSYSSDLSHNWASSCVDPVRGDFYAHSKTTGNFRRLPSGSTTWEDIASASIGTPESVGLFWDKGRDSLMCWNRNNGLQSWAYSSGVGSWVARGQPAGNVSGALGMNGHYCDATGELFLTDGSTNPTKFWLYGTNDAFSSALTAPLPVYTSEGGSNIVIPSTGSQRIVVIDKGTNDIQTFNPLTRLWRSVTPSNGEVPININTANSDGFAIDLLDLDCIFVLSGNSNGAAPSCYLFKPTRAPILPATITLSAGGSIDVAPYCENYNAATTLLSLPPGTPGTVTLTGSILSSSVAQTLTNQYIQETPV